MTFNKEFNYNMNTIINMTEEEFTRKKILGENSFEPAIESFKLIQNYLKRVFIYIDYFNDSLINRFDSIVIRPLVVHLERMKNFDITKPNAKENHRNHCNFIKDFLGKEHISNTLLPMVSISINLDLEKRLDQLKTQNLTLELHDIKKQKDQLDEILEDSKAVLEDIKNVAAESGASKYSGVFFEEAEEHTEAATKWLYGVIASISFAVIGAVLLFNFMPNADTTASVIQNMSVKLIIFSALYYAIFWSVKNYNAHRHNFIVNKHRANALSIFKLFIDAAGNEEEDKETKKTILTQTTNAIFSAQKSGYHKDPESKDLTSVINSISTIFNKK